jgi:hypothetical protein
VSFFPLWGEAVGSLMSNVVVCACAGRIVVHVYGWGVCCEIGCVW